MNQQQRKQLTELLGHAADLRAAIEAVMSQGQDLDDLSNSVDEMASEEREKFDNMPEGLQASERGQAIEEAADTLDAIKELLDEANGSLTELLDKLEEIAGHDVP